MEKWMHYELGLFWFCLCNFITATYLTVKDGLGQVHLSTLVIQYLLLILFTCLLLKTRRMRQASEAHAVEIAENPLDLKSHEKLHEQKRHYQVAAALIELGEKEQAVAYIETVLQEIA